MPWSVQRLDLLLPLCVSVQCDICPEDAVWLLLRLLVTVVLLEEPPLQQRQRNLERRNLPEWPRFHPGVPGIRYRSPRRRT